MALFKKDKQLQKSSEFDSPPSISEADLADAARLMDQWDVSLGTNSDAIWSCLEQIARRGGFNGSQALMAEVMDGKETAYVVNRPWRWWNEAARVAGVAGDDVLPGRIFLFAYLFTNQMADKMRAADQMETGIAHPSDEIYKSMAATAVNSLARLSPDLVVQDAATGRVDVAGALALAEGVTGIAAPRADAGFKPPLNDSGPLNKQ